MLLSVLKGVVTFDLFWWVGFWVVFGMFSLLVSDYV